MGCIVHSGLLPVGLHGRRPGDPRSVVYEGMQPLPTYPLLIDGAWIGAGSAGTRAAVDPYTDAAFAAVVEATDEDVDRAIVAARRALTGPWATTNGSQRAVLLGRLADLIEAEAEVLGGLESQDNGKLIGETTAQAHFAARTYRYYAGWADKILGGDVIPLDDPTLLDFNIREPIGVCALLIPWNSPMQLLANKLAPAIAAGNTVVIKPSEFASVSILHLARLIERAGFPAGVINVVAGDGRSIGRTIVEHPDLDLISFTGGVATGRSVMEAATTSIARLVLELGGKSPNIVFADADLERALGGAVAGIFAAAGQTCIAGSRLLVQRTIHDAFVDGLAERARNIRMGSPRDPATQMGPLANRPQFERVNGFLDGHRSAATLVCGGHRPSAPDLADGLFIEPTIFLDPTNAAPVTREEIFGPVLVVVPFDDEDEAVALANDSAFGLASGVWTRDLGRAIRMTRRVQAGTVWVNTYRAISPAAPFGGSKHSGIGRERGLQGLLEYTQSKNVMIDVSEGGDRDPFRIRT